MALSRRNLLTALPATIALRTQPAGRLPVPAANRLAFTALRDGSRIGTHVVTFTPRDDTLEVVSQVDYAVGLGPITLYRYRHHAVEHWRGGVLQDASSRANNDGTRGWMNAVRNGDRMAVDSSHSGKYLAPEGSIIGTHWNSAEVRAPMISPENGLLMHFHIDASGPATLSTPQGPLATTRYALSGYAKLELWYDEHGIWRSLRAVAKDNSIIRYRES